MWFYSIPLFLFLEDLEIGKLGISHWCVVIRVCEGGREREKKDKEMHVRSVGGGL